MLATTHTITGAAVGLTANNAYAAFGISFLLHFLLDTFLHWNFYEERHRLFILLAAGDAVFGLLVVYLILGPRTFSLPILAAVIGSLLPDALSFARGLFKLPRERLLTFHHKIQHETLSPLNSMISQAIVLLISFIIIGLAK